MSRKRVLFVGDAVCASGFARATHNILGHLQKQFDVFVLGVNYFCDPHPYPYPIYPAIVGGDILGIRRLPYVIGKTKPDVVILQTDPWNVPLYLEKIDGVPTIGALAIDGKNIQGEKQLSGLDHAIFWTKFGEQEAREGGYVGASNVIPLGIDLDLYQPQDHAASRQYYAPILRQWNVSDGAFVVGVVAKNQSRKRLDIALRCFAEWTKANDLRDAMLWMQVAGTTEASYDITSLAEYYGIKKQVVWPRYDQTQGLTEKALARVYGLFDVLLGTSLGEGWWFPGMEAMACGTPVIAPGYSGYAEWAEGAAYLVPCTETEVNAGPSTVGGVVDRRGCIEALDTLYRDPDLRRAYANSGLARVREPRFRWENIAEQYAEVVEQVLQRTAAPVEAMA